MISREFWNFHRRLMLRPELKKESTTMEMDMSNEKEMVDHSLFPEGWRFLRVKNVVESKSKAGNNQLVWTVEDTEEKTQDIIYTVSEQGKRWALKNMLFACGVKIEDGEKYIFELEDLENKIIMGLNKHVPNEFINRQGETIKGKQNKFKSFRPLTDEEKKSFEIPF